MKPYRPSNGTEGDIFERDFCEKCKRDAKFYETQDGADACPIHTAALMYDLGEPGYPKEWVKNDDDKFGETARCTAFENRLHCWAEGPLQDGCGTTCMLSKGHDGPHEWTSDNQIVFQFLKVPA